MILILISRIFTWNLRKTTQIHYTIDYLIFSLSFLSICNRSKIADRDSEAVRQKEARVRRVLHSKESQRQFIHHQDRESQSSSAGIIHSQLVEDAAAATDIPSRFSERFSRFSKILTRLNHIALRQIRFRFIFSHDLPSDSLK